ncbi:MAG: threonine ammonia-lyase, biosynthetic [Fimbriimonas sp.]
MNTLPESTFLSPREYLRRMRSSAVYNVAIRSALERAPILSRRIGNQVWLKREDQQPVFSFKLRGAYALMARLDSETLERGVVTASAGNHAQGVGLAAQHLGTKAVIVVPRTTPTIKVEAIARLGVELVLHGDNYDAAYAHARELEWERGLYFVPAYDHPDVIAGNGTVGLEIHEQHPGRLDAIFVAVGGGGLISGVALALKQLRPETKIIGVEPEDSDAMTQSLAAGRRITLERVGLFADGVAVRTPGEETFRICRDFVDDIVVVSNDAICAALKDVFEDRRAVLEPAGALAYAGLKAWAERENAQDLSLVAIACGANLNFDRLRLIAERAEVGERHEAILAVSIPERAGAFRGLCIALGERSVTEFNYRMGDVDRAVVFVGVKVGDDEERAGLVAHLTQEGYECLDLTHDEVAKTHLRHMVGGRCAHAAYERVFHFDFPERTGALGQFLDRLGTTWNISLFHYRNQGSDRGQVLCGIQVPPNTEEEFEASLARIGYAYTEQTANEALVRFLG